MSAAEGCGGEEKAHEMEELKAGVFWGAQLRRRPFLSYDERILDPCGKDQEVEEGGGT